MDGIEISTPMPNDQLLALDEALDRLVEVDGRAVELVKLCFFVGLSRELAAQEMGVSLSTAERLWSFARAWLYQEMNKEVRHYGCLTEQAEPFEGCGKESGVPASWAKPRIAGRGR